MTTPDPVPGSAPQPDDATSTYDAEAARAAAAEAASRADAAAAAARGDAGAAPDPAAVDPAAVDPAAVDPAAPDPGAVPWPVAEDAPWPTPPVASYPPLRAPGGAYPAGSSPASGAMPPSGGVPPSGGATPSGSSPASGAVPPSGSVPPSWGPAPAGLPPTRQPYPQKTTPPGLVAGVILVVIGAVLLASRFVSLSFGGVTWPLWIVVPGVAMLVGSFFIPPKGGVGLAIPGTIVATVGVILWVQEVYGLYATWAYAWALVAPTGPGLGMFLYGLVHRDGELIGDGFRTMLVGLGLFLGFALFFEGVIGLSGAPIASLDQVLPYAIIGLGVLLVVLSFFGGDRRKPEAPRPR